MLSLNIDDSYVDWANSTIEKYWDFSRFFASPYIKNDDLYISISDVTLKNAFFENLFWLIRDCYPEDDSRAMSFWGRLFEQYIKNITEKAVSSPYSYIDEFEWGGKRKKKKSSDAYIKNGENLLVVEAKGFSVLQKCMIMNTSIEDNNKLFIKPVLQADKFLYETISQVDDFKDIKEAYIVSVTMDNVNAVPKYYTDIISEIKQKRKCEQSKYFFNLSIEEYEMLMYVIENGYDCFALLKDYYCEKALLPFSTYLKNRYPSIEMTKYMKTIYEEATMKMKQMLFGN